MVVTAAYAFALDLGYLQTLTLYARYDHRRAQFHGFGLVEVDRVTAGARIELGPYVTLKGEYLVNRELAGAPDVDNNVATFSGVFSW